MKPVRTAIIGLGYFGPHLLRNFALQEECQMVWGCDLREANRKKAAALYPSVQITANAEEIFEDESIDLVIIATPPSTHKDLTLKALHAKKHVLVEKPIAVSSADAKAMVDAAEKNGVLLFVDHTFVFAPAVEKLVEYSTNGTLGSLMYFESNRINLGLIQKDANVLWDLAIHDLSILHRIKNLAEVRTVSAHGSAHIGKQIEHAYIHLEYADGFTGHIHVSWLSPVKMRKTTLAGTKAMVSYDDTEPSEKIRLYDRGVENNVPDEHAHKPDPFFPTYRSGDIVIPTLKNTENLSLEAQHVLACIQKHETPRSAGKDGQLAIRILELADESMHKNTPIPFTV